MAKYGITHSCGHDEVVNICGPVKARQGKADWMAESDCWECRKASESKAATEANAGLAPLVGSEKQVSWAETIRAKIMAGAEECMGDFRPDPDATEGQKLRAAAALAKLTTEASAKWWIDNRNLNGYLVIDDAIESTEAI